MASLIALVRIALTAAVLAGAGTALPAYGQQINPTADAVKEQQLLQQSDRIEGRCTLPDQKACVIEHPAGRDWRHFHEVTLKWLGAIAILGMLAVLILFYLFRGTIRVEDGRAGRVLLRFNGFERLVHWLTAFSFILLALTGLNVTYGKELLLPLIGSQAFSIWSMGAKYVHNFLAFPFTLGVGLIFFMWVAWQIPTRLDLEWLRQGGGIVGHGHSPAGRFNAGQKMIFWFVVLGGGVAATSGYFLIFPFYFTDIAGMQTAQIVHGVIAMLFVAVILAHIYIGTIGMEGAFEAMGVGTVDLNWAKQHHSVWLEQETRKGHVSAPPPAGTMQPAE